jgi:hypothetical protein
VKEGKVLAFLLFFLGDVKETQGMGTLGHILSSGLAMKGQCRRQGEWFFPLLGRLKPKRLDDAVQKFSSMKSSRSSSDRCVKDAAGLPR